MDQLVKRILLAEDDKFIELVTNFLNQNIIKTLIKTKNLDLSQFIDILNFEQNVTQDSEQNDTQNSCNSIKIQFI